MTYNGLKSVPVRGTDFFYVYLKKSKKKFGRLKYCYIFAVLIN
jgi:hypothetical protein